MIIHTSKNEQKILDSFGFSEDDESWQLSIMSRSVAISSLEKNSIYKKMDSKTQRALFKGDKAFYFERMAITHSPLTKKLESGIYNY